MSKTEPLDPVANLCQIKHISPLKLKVDRFPPHGAIRETPEKYQFVQQTHRNLRSGWTVVRLSPEWVCRISISSRDINLHRAPVVFFQTSSSQGRGETKMMATARLPALRISKAYFAKCSHIRMYMHSGRPGAWHGSRHGSRRPAGRYAQLGHRRLPEAASAWARLRKHSSFSFCWDCDFEHLGNLRNTCACPLRQSFAKQCGTILKDTSLQGTKTL